MENLENKIGIVKKTITKIKEYGLRYFAPAKDYSLFGEQYLEEPVVSGETIMAMSPTACTIKAIPVIDDF